MATRPRPLGRRIRDQLLFSVVAVLLLFLALRIVGVRAQAASLFLSILLTIALNVGLAAWSDRRARAPRRPSAPTSGGGDIRWRDEDR